MHILINIHLRVYIPAFTPKLKFPPIDNLRAFNFQSKAAPNYVQLKKKKKKTYIFQIH